MSSYGFAVLGETEEGIHTTQVGPTTNSAEEEHRPSKEHEPARAVRSGSQSSGSAPSVAQMNKSRHWVSVENEHQQIGLPPIKSHCRPPSWATEDESFITIERRLPDTVTRAKTGLEQRENSEPSLLEKVGRISCIPCSRSETEKKEDKVGTVELDAERPGSWVVDHHLPGLIVKIVPFPPSRAEGFSQRTTSRVKAMLGKPCQGERLNQHKESEPTYRVSFAEMQRMHLRKLQIGLVNHAVTMHITKNESPKWEEELTAYSQLKYPLKSGHPQAPVDLELVQAMKDYDYMMECSGRARDPFLATGERKIDHYVSRRVIQGLLYRYNKPGLDKPDEEHPLQPWEYESVPIGGTRKRTRKAMSFKDFQDRLILATVGAALLLGPMWLIHPSQHNFS